ncbi:MAG: hypothetical protein BGO55_08660 [Sphingobacteriales bacterium 50-39]|nr:MAG: hypothetical protein BGO55_08660 [Sphingobacteriales bacterium 50-39]
MKVTLILASGILTILSTAVILVTRANKRFTGFSTAVNWNGTIRVIGPNIFTTVAEHGSRAFLVSEGGTQEWYLFTKVNRTKLAYLK